MKKALLLITPLLLFLFVACEGASKEYNACNCEPILQLKSDIYTNTPVLAFYEAYTSVEVGGFINSVIIDIDHFELDSIQTGEKEYASINEFLQKFRVNIDGENRFVESPEIGYALGEDTARLNKTLSFQVEENWLEFEKIKFVWSKNRKVFFDEDENNDEEYYALHALKLNAGDKSHLSSEIIESARKFIDPRDNEIAISVSMNAEGTKEWAQMTSDNVANFIAIVSRGKVLSAPIVNESIKGGETLISGSFSDQEAQELTDLINCEVYMRKFGQATFEKELTDCSKIK